MKALKASARENKRYLLIEGKNPRENAERAILDGIGILGMSKAGLAWIKQGDGRTIAAVNREAVDEVRACFAIFPEKITVSRVSGSLKNLKG